MNISHPIAVWIVFDMVGLLIESAESMRTQTLTMRPMPPMTSMRLWLEFITPRSRELLSHALGNVVAEINCSSGIARFEGECFCVVEVAFPRSHFPQQEQVS